MTYEADCTLPRKLSKLAGRRNTVNHRLAWLKQYAAWGVQQGVVQPDMRRRIKTVPIQKKQQLAPRSLAPREARRLLIEGS